MYHLCLFVCLLFSCSVNERKLENKEEETHTYLASTTDSDGDSVFDAQIDKEAVTFDTLPEVNSKPPTTVVVRNSEEMRIPAIIEFPSGKIIDVRDVDPYRNIKAQVLAQEDGGLNRMFDISQWSKNQVEEFMKGNRINEEAGCEDDYLKIYTKDPRVESKGGITVIAYQAVVYCGFDIPLGSQGVALVYDESGNLLHRIEDRKDGFYDIRLSADGKYLMQKYGFDWAGDAGLQTAQGFRFYDTRTGAELLEVDVEENYFIGSYGPNRDTTGFHIILEDRTITKWTYVVPQVHAAYTKTWRKPVNLDLEMIKLYKEEYFDISHYIDILNQNGFKKRN